EGEGAGASSEPVVRTVRRTSVELFDAEGPAPAGQGYVTRTAYDVERVAGGPDAGTRVTVKLALRPEEGATPDHLASVMDGTAQAVDAYFTGHVLPGGDPLTVVVEFVDDP